VDDESNLTLELCMQTTFIQLIKIKRDNSGKFFCFIIAYICVLLFITSCATTLQINNSRSLQINISNEIARYKKDGPSFAGELYLSDFTFIRCFQV